MLLVATRHVILGVHRSFGKFALDNSYMSASRVVRTEYMARTPCRPV
jgi:hypothetical protein